MLTKFIRLFTGEDLMSEVKLEKKNTVLINPYKIVYMVSENGLSYKISLVPWVFDTVVKENTFTIANDIIILSMEPSDRLLKSYVYCLEQDTKKTPQSLDGHEESEEPISPEDFMNMLKDKLNLTRKKTLH